MTMKRKILLYYAPIIVTAMIIGSLYPYATSGSIILMILFLPVALLLWVAFFKVQKRNLSSDEQSKVLFNSKKMLALLLYSILISLIIFIGAFVKVASFREAIKDILFIPVVIQLLLWFVPFLKGPKKIK